MNLTVWMDSWQMECCGDPFRVGSRVSWTLVEANGEWLAAVLGSAAAAGVDAAEEHHGGAPEKTSPTSGTVTALSAVHCRYAPLPGAKSGPRHPVPGSSTFTPLSAAARWTADHGDLEFVGHLVGLDVPAR
ncbi:DUF6578 domain-containing protein [Streptomyces sp. NPDC020742]|uniref:DUF6578 domain-containing protein n=1 Tax=unclassified Streptomyces TaxID=2593676 RepID=UPI0033F568C0